MYEIGMADGFKINRAYAEKYNTWRQKEELQKLKDKYGDGDESKGSSSSESEDEDAEALTEQVERDWLRTLSALKSKDPKIYQKNAKFFHDDDGDYEGGQKNKKSKERPMFLKDYERKVMLEKGGVISEGDNSDNEGIITSYQSKLGYHQEQEQLRKSIVAAAGSNEDDGSDDGLLKRKEKSAEEKCVEQTDYLDWLKGQKEKLDRGKEIGVELEPLKNYWQSNNLDAGEKFLKNYILNRQYIDNDERMPTYDEIVNENEEDFSGDEELLIKQDTFERKYNFRYEEPGAAEINTFPRDFDDTVRRKDTKRSDKRKEVEERKKKAKEKKKEELKQLKKMKRQEIMDKLEKLKQITGNKTLGIDEKDLHEDFDPAKHDQMMQQCFDEEYYCEGEGEDVKPVFDVSDEEMENWDNWTGEGVDYNDGNEEEGYWNDDGSEYHDFIMDADYDPLADNERKKSKKEKKRKNKLAKALTTKKPVFDPNEKTFEEYFDEYYKLDYEDIIDDMPCRFKYRKVTPNSYGLSVDEILKCRDKELNAWASIKKMSQYRTENEEEYDIKAYSAKGKNWKKKQNILTSLFESEEKEEKDTDKTQTPGERKSKKKRNRKKKANKKKLANSVGSQDSSLAELNVSEEVKKKATERLEVIDGYFDAQIEKKTNRNGDKNKSESKFGKSDLEIEKDGVGIKESDSYRNSKKRKTEEIDSLVNMDSARSSRKKKKGKKVEEKVTVNADLEKVTSDEKVESCEMKAENLYENEGSNRPDVKKKKKKDGQKIKLSEERLKAYGINPKKYKYMKKEELFQIQPKVR